MGTRQTDVGMVVIRFLYVGNTEERRICLGGGDDEGNGGHACFNVPFSQLSSKATQLCVETLDGEKVCALPITGRQTAIIPNIPDDTELSGENSTEESGYSCDTEESCLKQGFPDRDMCSLNGDVCLPDPTENPEEFIREEGSESTAPDVPTTEEEPFKQTDENDTPEDNDIQGLRMRIIILI